MGPIRIAALENDKIRLTAELCASGLPTDGSLDEHELGRLRADTGTGFLERAYLRMRVFGPGRAREADARGQDNMIAPPPAPPRPSVAEAAEEPELAQAGPAWRARGSPSPRPAAGAAGAATASSDVSRTSSYAPSL